MKTKATLGLLLLLATGCGDDDKDEDKTTSDAGTMDAGTTDAGKQPEGDAAAPDAGPSEEDLRARGEYLVNAIGKCGDCHSPVDETRMPIAGKELSGVDCFVDADPENADFGCLSTPNLTNHETGLENRSDEEIKDMFLRGLRPNGEALHNFMPYWALGNMSAQDANAVVAYLRSLEGVEHMVKPTQAPFIQDEPSPTIDLSKVPEVPKGASEYDSAVRGRYLAANLGICLECHTPENTVETPGGPVTDPTHPRDETRAFQGGRAFPRALLGLPDTVFPETIFSHNLTPDETGTKGWTVADYVKAIKEGKDKDGNDLCAPMPIFGDMTDDDATDIANYLRSLEPVTTEWPECTPGDTGA